MNGPLRKHPSTYLQTVTNNPNTPPSSATSPSTAIHDEHNHLLERTAFSADESQKPLTKLDQSILLAFCLDVKNDNPADGLTAEQMSPFLERVLMR